MTATGCGAPATRAAISRPRHRLRAMSQPLAAPIEAEALDRDDPLATFRDRFVLPARLRYLDGNSLGALAKGVAERVAHVVAHEWGAGLIGSWSSAGWLELPRRVAARLAPFLGVATDEVAVADGTS